MSEKIKVMVEGGKAGVNPKMAQALGPMGINIGEVANKIGEKTSEFKGIEVPVTVEIHKDKSYDIIVGTPPASQLIKVELNIKKGSGIPNKDFVGNLAIEDIIKIAKMKESSLYVNNLKAAINTILGTCDQMGVLVESKDPKEIINDVKKGIYDSVINSGNTEVNNEKRDQLKEDLENQKAKFKAEVESIKAKAEKKEEKPATEGAEPKPEEKKEEVKKK